MIIAIDGPAGTGKSTIAKQIASKMQCFHLDTGAFYRAFAWYVQFKNVDPKNQKKVENLLYSFRLKIKIALDGSLFFIGKRDVTAALRSESISHLASELSQYFVVRQKLVQMQRRAAKGRDVVCEGRDIGTVVFPDAEVKIYLTADEEVRAKRRWKELQEKGAEEDFSEVLKKIQSRDLLDSQRQHSPLRKASNAIEIDTSNLSLKEVTAQIVRLVHEKETPYLGPPWLSKKKLGFLYRLIIFLAWVFCKIFYRHKVYGRTHLLRGAAVLASNHVSFLDPPLIACSCGEALIFLARKSLFQLSLFGKFIRALHAYPIEGGAGDLSVVKTIMHLLDQGNKILLFPEGTRSPTNELQPLKQGVGFLLYKAVAPVIPVYIHGSFQVWNRHRKWPKIFGKTACIFGSPIYPSEFLHLEKKEVQSGIIQRLESSIRNLKKWYEEGAEGTPP